MHLRLFDWGPSPFCMKVRAILNYKGVQYERVAVLGPSLMELLRRSNVKKVPEALYFLGLYFQWIEPRGKPMVGKAFGSSPLGIGARLFYQRRIAAQLRGQGTGRKAHVSPCGQCRGSSSVRGACGIHGAHEGLASGCERNVMMRCAAHFSPAERLQLAARRWIGLNWIRVGLVAISWWGALSAITRHG
jgi:hypothetical protein